MTRAPALFSSAFAALFALALSGCGTDVPAAADGVGRISAAIAVVPAGVNCLRVLAGSRSTDFKVTPGGGTIVDIDNVAAGSVSFAAFAFTQACSAIGTAAPTWASPTVTATVTPGQTTALTLKMGQVGSAELTIDFGDGGSAPPDMAMSSCLHAGTLCTVSSQCCSNNCSFLVGCIGG